MERFIADFESMAWKTPAPGMRFKAAVDGSRQLRLVEFTQAFIEPNWCKKAHKSTPFSCSLWWGGEKIAIEIDSFRVLEGRIPLRALGLVIEWASQHKNELLNNWELAKKSGS